MTTPRDSLLNAAQNRAMFDQIASRYDLLNRLLSLSFDRRWRRRTAAALAPAAGHSYLDLGCGTGDMALAVLQAQPWAQVVGVDPAMRMLVGASRKTGETHCTQALVWLAGDALQLPVASASFDGLVSAFCLRNLEHRGVAFAEMARVLRPGARICLLELTQPERPLMRAVHYLSNRWWVPVLGGLLSRGAAYRYLVSSISHFPRTQRIVAEMVHAGLCASAAAQPLSGGIVTLFVARRS